MTERPPLHLNLKGTNGVYLRQLDSESDLKQYQEAMAYANDSGMTNYEDIDLPTPTELRLAVEFPEIAEDDGDMYMGIWKKKKLLGGLMLRNYVGQMNLQFWLDAQAQDRGIASKAVSTFTKSVVGSEEFSLEIIARANEDNDHARRVLERSGYYEIRQPRPVEGNVVFGSLRQIQKSDLDFVRDSESITSSRALVNSTLRALDLRFDDEDKDEKFVFHDFHIVTDNDEKVEIGLTHDRKIKAVTIDIYYEIMDEEGGFTRQDDHQYLLHTSCVINEQTKKIMDFYQVMMIKDYRGVVVKVPEDKKTNSPLNKNDKLPVRDELKELSEEVPTFQILTMMKHHEDQILEMLHEVMANID